MTKEQTLGNMRALWLVFMILVVFYVCIGAMMKTTTLARLGPPWLPKALIAASIYGLFSFSLVLFMRYIPALRNLRQQPDDARVVRRWRGSWSVLSALALGQALFGLVFWLGNKTFTQSSPFFIIGSLLLVSLWPRQFWSSSPLADNRPLG